MIRLAPALMLIGLTSAPLAAQDARDFQLPPATATPDARAQGPIDPDAPAPIPPRVIATQRPPASAPSTAPIVLPTLPAATPAPAPSAPLRERPTAASTRVASPTPAPGAPGAPDRPEVAPAPMTTPVAEAVRPAGPDAVPPSAVASPSEPRSQGPSPRLGLALGVAALAAGLAAVLLRRRRRKPVGASLMPAAPDLPRDEPSEALALNVQAMRMDRSVLNATVGYRVTLRNRGQRPLSAIAIEADLVSASRERAPEQQLALPEQPLTPRHHLDRIGPGQTLRFEGEVRLPLREATAIWQGRAALLVPLLRVRATAAGAQPVATTLVIGRSDGPAARPQPFRLDEPPRSYAPLAQRVVDGVTARA